MGDPENNGFRRAQQHQTKSTTKAANDLERGKAMGTKTSHAKPADASWAPRISGRLREAAAVEVTVFTLGVLGGMIAQGGYAFAVGTDWASRMQTFALTNSYALAAVMVGGLLGFLFGVPRFSGSPGGPEFTITPNAPNTPYLPNTNLEQISDWLTKILVGVGLVQIGELGDATRNLFVALGSALGTGESATAFAGSVVVYTGGLGFMFGWLGTRTWVARLLTAPEAPEPTAHEASEPTAGSGVGDPPNTLPRR